MHPTTELNPEQRASVKHEPEAGPLLVLAGAGSGKTMTLAARVVWLVQRGADPQRLLLLTFSRRAAAEMARRAGRQLHQALRTARLVPGMGPASLRRLLGHAGPQATFKRLGRPPACIRCARACCPMRCCRISSLCSPRGRTTPKAAPCAARRCRRLT